MCSPPRAISATGSTRPPTCSPIRDAPDHDQARRAIEAFARDYGVKWPKAVAKICDDAEELLCFFDFPVEHWQHLKTSNPIESTFSTVRLRTRVTKGPGSKAQGLAMAFQAAGLGPAALAGGQRPAPGRAGAGRRPLRQGGDDRAS